VLKFFNNN